MLPILIHGLTAKHFPTDRKYFHTLGPFLLDVSARGVGLKELCSTSVPQVRNIIWIEGKTKNYRRVLSASTYIVLWPYQVRR